MIKRFLKIVPAVLVFAILLAANAVADERILNYHSDIVINTDGSLYVTETIRVRAQGDQIRRGIFRDFPTDYEDRGGNRYRTGFEVINVQRNGQPEPYHTERRSNGVRVYIGNANLNIPQGEHEYRLFYRSTRQLGFFDEFDELYWNVTGNGWRFPIDRASANIRLPGPVASAGMRNALYTGSQQQSGSDAEFGVVDPQTVNFASTRTLQPYEGLTVSVAWPKGLVYEPTLAERLVYFLKDNSAAIVFLLGLVLPLCWYLWSWHLYGRDPEKGVIIPRFKPPENLSAAACSYVKHMGLRSQAFTAAIISLGIKGYLRIDEDDDEYKLHRLKDK